MKCQLVVMKDLDARMLAKNASAVALAKRAGVSISWVEHARMGKPVRVEFAAFVEQALEQYEYRYKKDFSRGLPGRDYGRLGARV